MVFFAGMGKRELKALCALLPTLPIAIDSLPNPLCQAGLPSRDNPHLLGAARENLFRINDL
jgi:hypothetical protein